MVAITTLVSLFVILPLIVMKGVRDVKVGRARQSSGGEMRASELRSMIHTAVEEATAPLAARITDLEERLGDEPVHALRERIGGAALASAFDDPEPDAASPGAARRARS